MTADVVCCVAATLLLLGRALEELPVEIEAVEYVLLRLLAMEPDPFEGDDLPVKMFEFDRTELFFSVSTKPYLSTLYELLWLE